MNAVAGRRRETVTAEPTRFEDMRPGCYDIHARIADMDINGVWASLNFPSQIAGFLRSDLLGSQGSRLGKAVIRAWNDWHSRNGGSRIQSASFRVPSPT